ncbi:hypothetical protein Syn7502_02205 [Synechococcus sp. PCC 7502]|uniref:DUF4253 domain-containing protein n=1 Tax=Synechococcus sp. PCC 7502 TaxID=1173263 RepID=UPI00029FA135|nr:DUF4253 domain-containing protein [Synechococcus sp. PCC 7502]AFY74214.1 hypothetical protein Syn7502_02205 [Synechococcus sp. PCC 7502]
MLKDIQALLQGSFLAHAQMMELEIPRTKDVAIAIAITPENKIAAWKLLKSHLAQTQRYPVITTSWGRNLSTWEQSMLDADLFSRFYFDEEYPEQLSPEAMIARVDLYNDDYLAECLRSESQTFTHNLRKQLQFELENTESKFGIIPSESEIWGSKEIQTIVDVERYLLKWEQQHNLTPTIDLGYQDWFEPRDQALVLVLLPNPHSWNALAYLSWFGGSKHAIPLIRQWHRDFGAELVCHYGTMLQFFVERPPTDFNKAFELAWQQVALAPCTTFLPGVSIRNHARALLKLDRWFIHERP